MSSHELLSPARVGQPHPTMVDKLGAFESQKRIEKGNQSALLISPDFPQSLQLH